MKKLATASSIVIATLFGSVGCENSPSEKLRDAKIESIQAENNLNAAQDEYKTDMEDFKQEIEHKIAENEQSLAAFRARIKGSKKEAKADYDKAINELENKNTDMKRKLDTYKMEGKEKWNSFKLEFSHDMDEIGKALKDLTTDNI